MHMSLVVTLIEQPRIDVRGHNVGGGEGRDIGAYDDAMQTEA